MRSVHRILPAILLGLLLTLSARAEKVQDLKPQGYVNDFAGVLDAQTKVQIEALCAELDHKTQAQIAVVTFHSLEGVPIEDFSIKLATRWGIGPKKSDRGILILLAVGDRKYRVEVGYGLEPILPDGKVGGFGREMAPKIRAGDYNGALLHLTGEIAQVIARDRGATLGNLPTADQLEVRTNRASHWREFQLGPLIFLALIILFFMRGGWWVGPWIGGGRSWGRGWGGGGFGGGGGGFGGFGGGSFGGGGASGSW